MSRGVPITSRRGVQLAVLVLGGWLLLSAYLLATTGSRWLIVPACIDGSTEPTLALYFGAAWRGLIGLGFVAVALKDVRGPRLTDPALLGLVLTFAALNMLSGSAGSIASGIVRLGLGRGRCIEIDAPWSYGYAAVFLVIGAVVLTAAVSVFLSGADDD
jgi:hypothetical protein